MLSKNKVGQIKNYVEKNDNRDYNYWLTRGKKKVMVTGEYINCTTTLTISTTILLATIIKRRIE